MNTTTVVAYRFPAEATDEKVCTDPECTAKYAYEMATVAIGMTQADVLDWENGNDGERLMCASCGELLDGVWP